MNKKVVEDWNNRLLNYTVHYQTQYTRKHHCFSRYSSRYVLLFPKVHWNNTKTRQNALHSWEVFDSVCLITK